MNTLIRDITEYLQFLKTQLRLEIAICDVDNLLLPAILQISPFYGHNLSYCILLKKDAEIYKACKKSQQHICKRLQTTDSFCGTCFAGMSEYVYRIEHDGAYLGFLSVTGYCFDERKSARRLDKICANHNLARADLQKGFAASVRDNDVDPAPYIKPLLRMIELLYLDMLRRHDQSDTDPEKQIFLRAKSFINDNFTNDIDIDSICAHLHYSRSYVSHIFRKQQTMPIVEYINSLRILKARELLETTDYSVSEIAMQVGFNEPNYFTNTFKKYTRTTPLKFRKEKRK